jgi:hypothetical protein
VTIASGGSGRRIGLVEPSVADDGRRLPELVRPGYQRSTLADLLPSVGAHLGVPGCDDVLQLPGSNRYLVLLIDGLGWHLLRRAIRSVDYLADLLGEGRPITSGVPSTTVTSLTSLGTGLPPGRHGMVGFTSRVPGTDAVLNALEWDVPIDAREYQPEPTMYQRAADAGVSVTTVAPRHFATSGLTLASMRGAEFVGHPAKGAEATRIELITEAVARGDRSMVYAYERELDHAGHVYGVGSGHWTDTLARIDDYCRRLREALPADVTMIVTGDHGMIDIDDDHRLIAEDEPGLLVGVDAIAGEARFRQLYVDRGDARLVAARWADLLGDRAWVRTREEAIDDGWFGEVSDTVRERFGHVLVAMRDDWAIMTRTQPREMTLIGMHGSLTPAEMTIPLLIDHS